MKKKNMEYHNKTCMVLALLAIHLADPDRMAGCNIPFHYKGCKLPALFPEHWTLAKGRGYRRQGSLDRISGYFQDTAETGT